MRQHNKRLLEPDSPPRWLTVMLTVSMAVIALMALIIPKASAEKVATAGAKVAARKVVKKGSVAWGIAHAGEKEILKSEPDLPYGSSEVPYLVFLDDLGITDISDLLPAVKTLCDPSQVFAIILDDNNLGKLPPYAFEGFPNIAIIYLSNAGVTSIDDNTFMQRKRGRSCIFPHLEHLSLHGNTKLIPKYKARRGWRIKKNGAGAFDVEVFGNRYKDGGDGEQHLTLYLGSIQEDENGLDIKKAATIWEYESSGFTALFTSKGWKWRGVQASTSHPESWFFLP